MEVIEELCSFDGRLTGTDAERRAANRIAERLREQGRRVEVEPIYVHPQVGLVFALHCLVGVAGSLVAIGAPEVGFGLVLLAATSLYLDLNTRFYLLRRLFFRRVSQNVVARSPAASAKATLLLCAHIDAAKTGLIYKPGRLARLVRLGRALRIELTPPRLIFWSLALLVPILGARAAGVDSSALSLIQLLPTLVLLLAIFGLVELEVSDVVPGANDNASGVATVLSLAAAARREATRQPRRPGRDHRWRGVSVRGHALVPAPPSQGARPGDDVGDERRLGRPRRRAVRHVRGTRRQLRLRIATDADL